MALHVVAECISRLLSPDFAQQKSQQTLLGSTAVSDVYGSRQTTPALRAVADSPPSALVKVAMAPGKRQGVNASLAREGLSGPAASCVRATSVSRYREQTLNRHDQDRAPEEQHEIRNDPGHHLSDEGDRSDGVCRYDQRDRR